MNVESFRGKILFPLTYDPAQLGAMTEKTVVNQKNKEVPIFCKEDFRAEEMRAGISHLLDGGEDSIGAVYTFARREVLQLPKQNQAVTFKPRSGEEASLLLQDVGFVLFDSGVCFLQVDVAMEAMTLEQVMNTAYYLCEIKDAANRFSYEKANFDPQTRTKTFETVEFSVKELLLRCAEFLPGCGHFEDRPMTAAIAKPLLYSYYLLPEKPEGFEAVVSNIAQNYKLSYKGAESGDQHLYAFQNSAWCVSGNGAANVSHLVADETTNAFFRTTFPHKWESEYLFLFLNAIHQKYAVLRALQALSETARVSNDFEAMKEALEQSRRLQERCEKLKMRCFFDLPSRIDHVNRVYRFFRQKLQVPRYVHSLNEKLSQSLSVCESYTDRIKRIEDLERDVRSAQTEIKIALLTALITCLTFFNSFYATLQNLIALNFGDIGLDALIVAITFVVTIATATVNILDKREDIKELRKDIRKLKARANALEE